MEIHIETYTATHTEVSSSGMTSSSGKVRMRRIRWLPPCCSPGGGGGELGLLYYKRVGRGVGDICSFGAYLAKKGKKRVSMTPTMASMYPQPIWHSPA